MAEEASEWADAVGRALNHVLAEKGHTRKWLAQHIGLDPSTVTRILAGERPPTLDQLSNMATALGVTRRSLLVRADYLEADDGSVIDLDQLAPIPRAMVLTAIRTALTLEAREQFVDPV